MRRRRLALSVVLTAGLFALAGLAASSAQAAPGIFVVTSPGTNPPPATLGPYTMTSFPTDSKPTFTFVSGVAAPTGGTVGFSPSLYHLTVGGGWSTWSNGYTGDVYATLGQGDATLSMPTGTTAFYLYAEPDVFGLSDITATAQDGTTATVSVEGNGGAQYFGFYGTGGDTISSITVSGAGGDFAVGEFGIANVQSQLDLLLAASTGVGPGTSLADKVRLIESYLAANDTADACGTLAAYIKEVKAQTGKSIPAGTAASLIAQAQAIEAEIGC
jgi:hypothetical protein